MVWTFLLYLLLAAILLVGLYINLVNAPGLWVMVLAAGGYAWVTHGNYLGWRTLALITGLALVAEAIEFMASGAAAKKAGASKGGVIGAIIGGIVGAVFLTVSVPVPAVGTILGICLGTFLGALVGEMAVGSELGNSLRVGVGAVKGRLLGLFTKLMFGCAILGIVLVMALPLPWRKKTTGGGAMPPTTSAAR